MANTSHQSMADEGGNFAVIIPITLTSGKAGSLGTPVKHEAVEGTEMTFSNAASSTEYISKVMDNGVTVEVEKNTKVVDGRTGAEKSGSGDAVNKVSFTTLETSPDAVQELLALKDTYVLTCVPLGFGTDGTSMGYGFLLSKLSGDLVRTTKGNDIMSIKVEFAATTLEADAAFTHATLNTGFGIAVDPMGGDAITKIIDTGNAFTAGELTQLLAGEIVLKDAA